MTLQDSPKLASKARLDFRFLDEHALHTFTGKHYISILHIRARISTKSLRAAFGLCGVPKITNAGLKTGDRLDTS
jgi:hypothetical protein